MLYLSLTRYSASVNYTLSFSLIFFYSRKMAALTAEYKNTTNNTTQSFTVNQGDKTLTEAIVSLQDQINTFLTQVLENEKNGTVPSVQEDEAEKQKQEEGEEEEEDASMVTDRRELSEEQVLKKQKTCEK
ncbi:hypothetical protein EDC96DRAFT_607565 [Choanephora cucurbitarum]|nr:hypothetical protein EDC96DRAFT_607565 [Choanephora cucurbitarum]